MDTFLDINIEKTKSFILYGNLKDIIWCPDLMPRDFEHYLVKLLKSRGYEHIIFYGEAGTKGAYCLDEKSARFFFSSNAGIPLPETLDENFDRLADEPGREELFFEEKGPGKRTSEISTGSQVSDALSSLFGGSDEGEYMPGDLSSPAIEEEETGEVKTEDLPKEKKKPENYQVRYAYRGQKMSEFLQRIHPLMLERESHMAVVFYNILTTDIRSSDLRDDILDIWEKNGKGNICLMLVPETANNASALETRIQQYGLESKFLQQLPDSGQFIPNMINCVRIGQPNTDEIKNMLRYLALVGTEKKNKIVFQYSELEEIAQRIQYASGKRASQSELCIELACEYMTELFNRLSRYINKKARPGRPMELRPADIDMIWEIRSDQGKALQELQKEGWKPAYDKVMEVLKIARKAKKREQQILENTEIAERKSADWGVQRVEVVRENRESHRRPIPNFVLLGNPGTGKTTIARLLGRILQEEGLLKTGQTIEVKKENLTNSYVAGVPKATMAQVNAAEEGVLFIDEAHLLGKKDGGVGHDGTGVEVVSTLNAAMTSPNHHFSVILAGYEEEMNAVFELDPGFKSRFGNNFIYLKDYEPELLTKILLQALRTKGYRIDEGLTKEMQIADTLYVPIRCMVQRLYSERDRKRFGNARVMNDLASYAEGNSEKDCIVQADFYGGCGGKIDKAWFSPMDIGASTEYILADMERRFVGMREAKEAMRNIGLELKDYKERGISRDEIKLRPIILVGNPGTGKTSLAKILPRLYFHYQLLGTAQPIIVSAGSFADRYAGGAQEKALEYIRKAQDVRGFLFVDEAHELLNEHFDGRGAFKAFMAPVTDNERPFLVCFAVYPNKLSEFLKMDIGAQRRFRIIYLEDYTGEELFSIMRRKMTEKGYSATEETENLLKQVFCRIYQTRTEQTGNAGKVENILEEMDVRRRKRCVVSGIEFGRPESLVFEPEDIPENLCGNLTVNKDLSNIERLQKMKKRIESERVGNHELKEVLGRMVDSLIYCERFPRRAKVVEPGHYFFKGNPGTGKTTGAKFFAKYLYELGLVQSPEPVFISASSLVGQYLGETGIKTREQLTNAIGRVLMIDEAYALAEVNSNANSYKKDAVNEIINFLDNAEYRKTTCVIFAGYEHDMDELYQMNAGFKSRVSEVFFEDFTVDQSVEILRSILDSEYITLSSAAAVLCREQIGQMQRCSGFANGRTIRRYSNLLCGRMEQRCIQNAGKYAQDDPQAYEIQEEDIPEIASVLAELNIVS